MWVVSMNFLKKCKENKAVMGVDIVVSIVVLSLFAGVIAGMFAELFIQNVSIRMNAMAVNYAIIILENTDRLPYAEVTTENMMNNVKEKYYMSDNYTANIEVTKYSDMDTSKEDLIKIVKVTISYELLGQEYSYTVQKLKIKEM